MRSPGGAPQPSLTRFPKSSFELCKEMAKTWIPKHPKPQRHSNFLRRVLMLKWSPNHNTKPSAGFGSWMSLPGGHSSSSAETLSPTAKTGLYSATASLICPDRLPCPPHVAALDSPHNILAISNGNPHKKGDTRPPHSHPAASSDDFSRMKRNHRVSHNVSHEG